MYSLEYKKCPRCNSEFECKVGSINMCHCSIVTLNNKDREYMRENFEDCLCASCIKDVKSEYRNQLFQNKLKSIIEKLHK